MNERERDADTTRDPRPIEDLTAFVEEAAAWRAALGGAPIDAASLELPIRRCDLAGCRGMCCYDGIFVSAQVADRLREVASRERAFFERLGLDLPADPCVTGEWFGHVGLKTATRPHPFRSLVRDYPDHFNDTACVFLVGDGRCGLQALAIERGLHPWFYKPLGCWLHPISIRSKVLHLESEETDPTRRPGFDGYECRTFCGAARPDGQPAAAVLSDELRHLGAILGRDLLAEIAREATDGSCTR